MPPAAPAWIETLLRRLARGELFHIVDTETTGTSPTSCRVIELATVTLRGTEVVDRFDTLIDPGVPVPAVITRITGISTPMLRGAPAPADAFARWKRYLGAGAGVFVAHNAPFDWGFLTSEFTRAELEWPFSEPVCTVRMARHCLPHLPSRSLEALIRHYRIRPPARHRALADAEATAIVFGHLVSQLESRASGV